MAKSITLTTSEMFSAASVGVLRRLQSLSKGYNKNVHAEKSDWATDIDGAAAEMAVSKALGRYWSCHAHNLHGDDVLGGIQVRSTAHPNGHLVVRKRDAEHKDRVFVLVVSNPPTYTIVGAMKGEDAMADAFYRLADNRGGESWWVPQDRLADISEAI